MKALATELSQKVRLMDPGYLELVNVRLKGLAASIDEINAHKKAGTQNAQLEKKVITAQSPSLILV